jgi:hypothetical protein
VSDITRKDHIQVNGDRRYAKQTRKDISTDAHRLDNRQIGTKVRKPNKAERILPHVST